MYAELLGKWEVRQTMARMIRIQYAGAVCHVMGRGDRQVPIFRDDTNRRVLLEALSQARDKMGRTKNGARSSCAGSA